MKVSFHPEAATEFEEAVIYYEFYFNDANA